MSRSTPWVAAAALTSILVVVACGSDDETNAPTNFTTSATSSTSSTSGTGGGGAGGGDATTSTTASGTGGGGGQGGGVNCDDPSGCYDCPPVTNDQHLNACTDAQCTPFDNVARLPLYNGGNLPPVP